MGLFKDEDWRLLLRIDMVGTYFTVGAGLVIIRTNKNEMTNCIGKRHRG